MEVSLSKWTPELGTDYSSFLHQYQMNPLDYSLDEIKYFQSYSSERDYESTQKISGSNVGSSHIHINRPAEQLKTDSWNSCIIERSTPNKNSPSSSSQIISFGKSTPAPAVSQPGNDEKYAVIPKTEEGSPRNLNLPSLLSEGSSTQETGKAVSTTRRNSLQAQDHVISERKRREKLSQRFIALSALVPGLKKTDKASVLGDTIKYLKQLQERVKSLEEQAAKKTMESVIIVKKSHMARDGETSCSDDNFDGQSYQLYLPHVEARVSDKNVLIRIHCENNKGSLINILSEIEKLPLTVLNSNVLPFGNSTLDVTVIAQMDVEKTITVKDLAENLRLALLKYT